HRRHVAGDLLVSDHHQTHLRQHGTDDPFRVEFTRARRGGARLHQLATEAIDLAPPPDVTAPDTQREGEIEQEDDLPARHQCTCSAGGATTTFSSVSVWTFASRRSVPRGAASSARR